jgi:hypothetical protein
MKRVFLVLATLSVAFPAASAQPVEVKPPQQKVLGTPTGRYVFGQVSEYRRDQYLLDTQTGRLWQVVSGQSEQVKLQPVPFIQVLGDEAYMPDPDDEVTALRKLTRMKTAEEMKKALTEGQGTVP